jgi:hypothetical protein
LRPPTAFEKYFDSVKTFQSRKEALASFKRQTEASQAQQADQNRLLQSKRLNLNTVTLAELEAVMPSLSKPTGQQIMNARAKGLFTDWKSVSDVHGVGEKVLQNLKVYFNEPGKFQPVHEEEEEEPASDRPGKRSHQVQIATIVSRQVLLARQKLKPGKLWSDTGCMKPVAHREVHKLQIAELKKYGLKPVLFRKTDEFQFGDGEITVSKFGYVYPVIFQNIYRGLMFQASVDVPCPSLLALPVMKQWDLDICTGKGVIQINRFGVTIPFEGGLPYVDIFDAKESGINGPIPTVFKRTLEENSSGHAVFRQLPNVINDFWTTKSPVSAALAERRRKLIEKAPTTRPFQDVLVANKTARTAYSQEDFDFGQE